VTPLTGSASSGGPSSTLSSFDNDASVVYASLSTLRQADLTMGRDRIEEDQAVSKEESAQEQEAIKKEAANQADSGDGFFSCVGHFVGDVVSDIVQGHFGDAVDDAGRDLGEAWNSPSFWHDLETGLEGIAIVAAAVTTAGIGGVVVGGAVIAAAGCVGAVAGVGAGLSKARVLHFAAAAEDATADATDAQNHVDQLQQVTSNALADLKQESQSHERAIQSLAQTVETHDQTTVTAASMTVRG
jgi:hypothetical protein